MTDDDTITSTRDYADYSTEDEAENTQPVVVSPPPAPFWYPDGEHEQRKTGEHIAAPGPTDPPESDDMEEEVTGEGDDKTVDRVEDNRAAAGA